MGIETLRMNRPAVAGCLSLGHAKSAAGIKTWLRAISRLIENSDWDERILKMERRLDRLCWAAVIAFVVCLMPAFLKAWL
jgi:hypothetical protein